MKDAVLRKDVIVRWKKKTKTTDVQLASFLGIHPITLSKYINGHRAVPAGALIRLQELTGIDYGELVKVINRGNNAA